MPPAVPPQPPAPNHPKAGQFDDDPRVSFDKTAGKYQYEDDAGQEWEWAEHAWIPIIDEDTIKAHQSAYAVSGVDENVPANAVLAREERRAAQKRKKELGLAGAPPRKQARPAAPPSAPKKTAVFVTNLPPSTTVDQLAGVFSKAGVLLLGDDGEPRIKLYHDENGRFKGEALVMYFKEGSVQLAVTLLDETELELGGGMGVMRVREAEYEAGKGGSGGGNGEGAKMEEGEKENGAGSAGGEASGSGSGSGSGAGTSAAAAPGAKKKEYSHEEKARMSRRIRAMQDKITWHETDDAEDALLGPVGSVPERGPGSNRMNRVVVLKGMFKLADLDKDPALLLELKEDVREEAETMGEVTSVVLYDKEEDGVMTVKFREPRAAEACVLKMNGRYFDKQRIYAGIYTGKERYRRSGKGDGYAGGGGGGDEDAEEQERLDGFAQWLVEEDEG